MIRCVESRDKGLRDNNNVTLTSCYHGSTLLGSKQNINVASLFKWRNRGKVKMVQGFAADCNH